MATSETVAVDPEPADEGDVREEFWSETALGWGSDAEPGSRRRRLLIGVSVVVVIVALIGGSAAALLAPAAPVPPAEAGQEDSGGSGGGQGATGADAGTGEADPAAGDAGATSGAGPSASGTTGTPGVSAVAWHGAALPTSASSGPFTWTRNRSSGFASTEAGLALAAVHISTHIDPYSGPDVFGPTIKEQVVGDSQNLLARTRRVYREAAARAGVSKGQPVIAATGEFVGWRLPQPFVPEGANVVDLLVNSPDGDQSVYSIPMVWRDGDWNVELAPGSRGNGFTISTASDATDYQPFQ